MPVWQIGPKQRPQVDQELLAVLLQEWQHPSNEEGAPLIMEERDTSGQRIQKIYIIWDRWEGLGGVERSELIMEACERRYGSSVADDVLVAMGLTHDRAEAMKWLWERKPGGGTNYPNS